jgi:hypothetical protein
MIDPGLLYFRVLKYPHRAGRVAQVVERLASKGEALSSNPNTCFVSEPKETATKRRALKGHFIPGLFWPNHTQTIPT